MYCTPCARLMKSITPNTSVSPAAIRNSSTPNCKPLSVWTMSSVVDIRVSLSLPRKRGRDKRLLHRAVGNVRIGVVREHLLRDFGLVLAVGALCHLDQIEVL